MAEHAGLSETENTSGELPIRGNNVVAVIDFHQTRIFLVDPLGGSRAELVDDVDPQSHSHKIAHKAGNPDGTYHAGNPDYWREITDALAPARAILLLGHGKGKANASHQWVGYVEEHDKDVAAKIVAEVRADIDDLTDADVVELARRHFGLSPERYRGRDPRVAVSE